MEKLFQFTCIVFCLICLWFLSLFPVFLYGDKKCLEAGYPKALVTYDYTVYCTTLDGVVQTPVVKLKWLTGMHYKSRKTNQITNPPNKGESFLVTWVWVVSILMFVVGELVAKPTKFQGTQPNQANRDMTLTSFDLVTVTLRKYPDSNWGIRRLSFPVKDRWALDFGHISIIVELWFLNQW